MFLAEIFTTGHFSLRSGTVGTLWKLSAMDTNTRWEGGDLLLEIVY
jgi:hypothetical protein